MGLSSAPSSMGRRKGMWVGWAPGLEVLRPLGFAGV